MSDLEPVDLLEIALKLHRADDAGRVCEVAVDALDERGLDPVSLLLAEEGGLRVRAWRGEVPDPEVLIEEEGPLFHRLRTGVPVSSADTRAAVLARLGATMAYPLEGRRCLVGLLCVQVGLAGVGHVRSRRPTHQQQSQPCGGRRGVVVGKTGLLDHRWYSRILRTLISVAASEIRHAFITCVFVIACLC